MSTTPKDFTSAERASPSTIAEPVEQLDLATVIKVSQALSGEMVLDEQNMALANLLAAFAEMDHVGGGRPVKVRTHPMMKLKPWSRWAHRDRGWRP